MTIINGIEIDIGPVPTDTTKVAILNNDKIEPKLHVITVISNPCQYARRYILAREFIKRMEQEQDIIVYVVELTYWDHKYYVTKKGNKRHLQLRGDIPLWHKENMINIGVKKLLPPNWKAFAWIDADVEFENASWASDALKVLNGYKDVIQLFSHAIDMDKNKYAMSIFPSFGFQYSKGFNYGGSGINMWHPGFAWAMTRKAYEKLGGLYEKSILGAGDHNMSFSFIGYPLKSLNEATTQDYKDSVLEFYEKSKNLRLGYIPGLIRHYFHGSKKNRKYSERWKILVDKCYTPSIHLTKNKDELLVPSSSFPKGLADDIMKYFSERNEDEGLR
jgi:hypothetical protein